MMNWLSAHEKQLNVIFAEAKEAVRQFPSPLDSLGLCLFS